MVYRKRYTVMYRFLESEFTGKDIQNSKSDETFIMRAGKIRVSRLSSAFSEIGKF